MTPAAFITSAEMNPVIVSPHTHRLPEISLVRSEVSVGSPVGLRALGHVQGGERNSKDKKNHLETHFVAPLSASSVRSPPSASSLGADAGPECNPPSP